MGIIGGGPGGYVAAIRASQLGLTTVLVEKEHLGGVCLNWGCIPTKALLKTAELKKSIDHASEFGLEVGPVHLNLETIVARSRHISAQLAGGIKHLLKKNKVTVIEGHASIAEKGILKVTPLSGSTEASSLLKCTHIIIATGAKARTLPHFPSSPLIWTAKEAMVPTALPTSLAIIGSGAIGIEFATFYRALGVDVTVIELQDRILPQEDHEISKAAQICFEKDGIKFLLNTTVQSSQCMESSVTLTFQTAKNVNCPPPLTVDRVIMAVGIVGNTQGLNLEATAVKVEKNQILTDQWCQTHEPGIYAIGDVTGPPWLAHKASHEGIICVEKIAGISTAHPLSLKNIPACTYSIPQVASVGFTQHQAEKEGYSLKIGRFPYKANGKALAMGETDGLIKTIFDAKTGELLGAHLLGCEVTELIQGFTVAKTLETTENELMQTIFPHPTLSEMMHESVLDAYGKALHF